MIVLEKNEIRKIPPKQRILKTAIRLFYNQGYANTGINQIIKESGTAKASFYDHYPSKEDLGKRVIHHYSIEVQVWFKNILKNSKDPLAFVEEISKAVQLQIKSKNTIYHGCPIALFSSQFPIDNSGFQIEFQSAVEKWEKMFLDFFTRLKEENKIPTGFGSLEVARDLINLYEGGLMSWRISQNKDYISRMEISMIERIRSELKK
ncbi:TetR/AcrR family transcriptional regulator [Leptospira sp. 'Mane']|uniref:TetR/AcrR family transcriptional regulator n=1 Tax=Leptospira sp. 'Mane' TaxID=3387407 RepID=UPI00398AA2AC